MDGDYAAELDEFVRDAAFAARALRVCPHHPQVTLRETDPETERETYRIAYGRLKRGNMHGAKTYRQSLVGSLKAGR